MAPPGGDRDPRGAAHRRDLEGRAGAEVRAARAHGEVRPDLSTAKPAGGEREML